MSNKDTLFEVRNLSKLYRTREERLFSFLGEDTYLKAVDDVDFDIHQGEILGLAGQSGCGKSTLGDLLVSLEKPTSGEILFNGRDISEFNKKELKQFRRRCQVIFQDPYESLNPRFPVARIVSEPLVIHGIGDRDEREERVHKALNDAGLDQPGKFLDKLPSQLSGGERQRVSIARALVLEPQFLVADEPVSMLDVSVRTGILQLFKELQESRDLTMLYISHDLSTINYLTDRTMIMYLGNIVETGETRKVIGDPAHPYTETLLNSVPVPDPNQTRSGSEMEGEVPDPVDMPDGCRFQPYCSYSTDKCREDEPERSAITDTQEVACYHPVNQKEKQSTQTD